MEGFADVRIRNGNDWIDENGRCVDCGAGLLDEHTEECDEQNTEAT